MNLIPKRKKSAPAVEAATAAPMPTPPSHPTDDIRDLDALAAMLQQLKAREETYQRAIDALIAARRIVNGWDPKPEHEPVWSVRRDVLAALGDQDALAAFEREHATDIANEQAARQAVLQQSLEAPARAKALERYIKDLAAEMRRDVDEAFIRREMIRMFTPSAQRMLDAALAFVQAWREMNAVEATLQSTFRISHYSVQGDDCRGYDMTLIGDRRNGDLIPELIEGLAHQDLAALNRAFRGWDTELSSAIKERLHAAGIPAGWFRVYRPGSEIDSRPVYAPDPNPPRKRPQEIPMGHVVTVPV
ncbi:hypothetical protein ACI2TD_24930 [Ralstonia nicotianae]